MTDANSLETMLKKLTENMVPFEEFGCYLALYDGTLFFCSMLKDGTPELDENEPNWGEVTAPEDQEFLDAVNAHFQTNFRLEQFAGR